MVAGSDCGSPVTSENVLPCFQHSISRSSHITSPSDSEMSACVQRSPMAYTSSSQRIERDAMAVDVDAPSGPGRQLVDRAHHVVGHAPTLGATGTWRSSLPATRLRNAVAAAAGTGSLDSTSSKKPVTTSRSAIGVGTPRLSR